MMLFADEVARNEVTWPAVAMVAVILIFFAAILYIALNSD